MPAPKPKNPEIRFTVKPEVLEQVQAMADQLGMYLGDLGRLCLILGFKALDRNVNSEKYMTPEVAAAYYKASGVTLPPELQEQFNLQFQAMAEQLRQQREEFSAPEGGNDTTSQ